MIGDSSDKFQPISESQSYDVRTIGIDGPLHRVIIEGACLPREREESDAILPDRSVQRHSL